MFRGKRLKLKYFIFYLGRIESRSGKKQAKDRIFCYPVRLIFPRPLSL